MEFVSDQNRADELLDKWLSKDNTRAFYLDFEADNYHHYEEVLATAQICYGGRFYLFDAINLDLKAGFREILQTKPLWLHGCDYDLYLLKTFVDVVPEKLYDTQIAARLCGFRKFGYASLVEQICGKTLPKDSQRADWTKRPLPEKMMKYAEDDVRYLPQISDILIARLEKLKRVKWFTEACSSLTENYKKVESIDPAERWRINGSSSFKPNELHYLKTLWHWRDEEAKQADLPCFKVSNNQTILDWSQALAEGSELSLPKGMRDRRRVALTKALEGAKSVNEESFPQRVSRGGSSRVKIDETALKELMVNRDKVAAQHNLEGSCIASRKVLEAIVKDPQDLSCLQNWQRELLQL